MGAIQTNTSLERMQNNDQSLTTLNLNNKNIGNQEAIEIATALKDNHTLTTLDLDNNQVVDSGACDSVR